MTDTPIEEKIEEIFMLMEENCENAIAHTQQQLSHLRTGRPQADILAGAQVEYHGAMTPISQVSSITVEQQNLLIKPWDKGMIKPIMNSIARMNQDFNPKDDGKVIRLPMPTLTSERRLQLIKDAKQEAENGRVRLRNARRDANAALKNLTKAKSISEDDERDYQKDVTKTIGTFTVKVDEMLENKEKQLQPSD